MVKNKGGVQSKLNALARTSEFQRILQQEVKDHKLVLQDVQKCVGTIYREVCKRPHGNTGFITLNEGEFTMGELVVLISFFRLQSKWANALDWKAIWKKCGKREGLSAQD